MRSIDYSNNLLTFTPLEPHHMVRVALVNGLNGRTNPDFMIYRELVKEFTNHNPDRIDRLSSIISGFRITQKQREFLDDLITEVDYLNQSGIWDHMNYGKLEKAGVIIGVDSVPELVEAGLREIEYRVLKVNGDLQDPDKDYLKHINWRDKIRLDSKEVIEHMPQLHKSELSETYLRYGRLTSDMRDFLNGRKYTLQLAMASGFNMAKQSSNQGRTFVVFSFRNPTTGDEVRFHLQSLFQGFERFAHRHYSEVFLDVNESEELDPNEIKIEEIEWEYGRPFRYARNEFAHVPKRRPHRKKRNFVNIKYNPKYELADQWHDWLEILPSCNCEHGLNLENFEVKRGNAKRYVRTIDSHVFDVMLEAQYQKGGFSSWVNAKSFARLFPNPRTIHYWNMLNTNTYVQISSGSKPLRRRLTGPETEEALIRLNTREWDYDFGLYNMFGRIQDMPHKMQDFRFLLEELYITPLPK